MKRNARSNPIRKSSAVCKQNSARQSGIPSSQAVKRYELIAAGDRIAVCISGGKDSMLMAKLMQMLARHSDVPFEPVFLVMDPGYNEINRRKIESNAALLHIPVTIFETDIFAVANSTDKSPCYLCARMRRGYLYSQGKGARLQQDRARTPFQRRGRDDGHGHVLRLAAASHAAEAAQHQFCRHGADPPAVLRA